MPREFAADKALASAAGVTVKKTRKTVADLAEYFMEVSRPKRSSNTLASYGSQIRVINEQLGKRRFEDLTLAEIHDLHRSFGDKTYMANRTVTLLKAIGNLAIKRELIRTNPVVKFTSEDFHKERRRNDYLTPEEMERLFEALPENGRGDAIRTLALTGARKGEVLGMCWNQIEGNRWTKPAWMTKQDEEHIVYLNSGAMEIINRQPRVAPRVFTSNGRPIADLNRPFERALKAAGVRHRRLHDLRHSFASLLASSGVSLHVVGKMLGHSRPATTARYADLYSSALEEAAEKADVVKMFADRKG